MEKPITEQFIDLVNARENIFLTGSGGVGKSFNIKELIRRNAAQELPYFYRIALTATTGIAALNIGGQTIHKFSGAGVFNKKSDIFRVINSDKWEEVRSRIQASDIIIIDEISMLRSDQFNFISYIFQHAMRDEETGELSTLPFGGKQMIFVGDFLQLPPVVKTGEDISGIYPFVTKTWKEMDIKTIHLTKVMRQADEVFINALNEVRMGKVSPATIDLFKTRVINLKDREFQEEFGDIISLTALNSEADEINEKRLAKLDTPEESFFGSRTWGMKRDEKAWSEKERKQLNSHYYGELEMLHEVKLKSGCRVLITANAMDESYVNGHLGTYRRSGYVVDLATPKYECVREYISYEGLEEWPNAEMLDDYTLLIKDSEENDDKVMNRLSTYTKIKLYYELHRTKKYDFTPAFSLVIDLDDAKTVFVQRTQKEFYHPDQKNDEMPALTLSQFPVRLGWAISMHKSQGQTLEKAYIEPENIFAPHQFYVALSRVKSLDGIYLKSFSAKKVMVDRDAINFYRSLQ